MVELREAVRRSRRQLARSEPRFAQLLDSSSTPGWMNEPSGSISSVGLVIPRLALVHDQSWSNTPSKESMKSTTRPRKCLSVSAAVARPSA